MQNKKELALKVAVLIIMVAAGVGTGILIREFIAKNSTPQATDENMNVRSVKFYLADTSNDSNGSECFADGSVRREMTNPDVDTVIEELISLVLTTEETGKGLKNGFDDEVKSTENLTIKEIISNDDRVVVNFDDPDNFTSGGSCRVELLKDQLIQTLQDFKNVPTVEIGPEELFQP